VIISRIISGLGNQLFQWAAGHALAVRNETELRLDISFFNEQTFSYSENFPRSFKLKQLRVKAKVATPRELARAPDFSRLTRPRRRWYVLLRRLKLRRFLPRLKESSLCFQPAVLTAGPDVYLEGYWPSERYFESAASSIREEAQVADPRIESFVARVIHEHRRPGVPLIGVQVRKGDIRYLYEVLKTPEKAPMPLLPTEYFLRAMQHFAPNCTFLMFSDSADDIQLCKEEFKDCKNVTYMTGNDDITDFAILQKCDHQIISNSSFGWWAAWLNPNPRKTVVAPKNWFSASSPYLASAADLIPPSWILK
jgi:hypothetical protein